MTNILPSYIQGAWWTPASDDAATEVRDASTGEVVARVSTEGLDLDFAYAYGNKARFRANYFFKVTGLAAVFRTIPTRILSLVCAARTAHVSSR